MNVVQSLRAWCQTCGTHRDVEVEEVGVPCWDFNLHAARCLHCMTSHDLVFRPGDIAREQRSALYVAA